MQYRGFLKHFVCIIIGAVTVFLKTFFFFKDISEVVPPPPRPPRQLEAGANIAPPRIPPRVPERSVQTQKMKFLCAVKIKSKIIAYCKMQLCGGGLSACKRRQH